MAHFESGVTACLDPDSVSHAATNSGGSSRAPRDGLSGYSAAATRRRNNDGLRRMSKTIAVENMFRLKINPPCVMVRSIVLTIGRIVPWSSIVCACVKLMVVRLGGISLLRPPFLRKAPSVGQQQRWRRRQEDSAPEAAGGACRLPPPPDSPHPRNSRASEGAWKKEALLAKHYRLKWHD